MFSEKHIGELVNITNKTRLIAIKDALLRDQLDMVAYIASDMVANSEISDADLAFVNSRLPQHLRVVAKKSFMLTPKGINLAGLKSLAPREFILKRFNWEKGMLINVCGTGNSGKSLFVQYVATCLSSGQSLFNSFDFEPGTSKVLHIDQEQSEVLTQRRYERIAAGIGAKSICVDRTKLPFKLDDPSFSAEEIKSSLIDLFKQYGVVIIDSLRGSLICDENNSQIAESIHMLRQVAEESKCLILLIHHMGKGNSNSKQSGRGSSAIYDAVDGQLDMHAQDGIISIKCAKNRDGLYWDELHFSLKDEGEFVESQFCTEKLCFYHSDTQVDQENNQELIILSKIRELGSANQKILFECYKGSRASFGSMMADMEQQSLITVTKGAKNACIYTLGKNADEYFQKWSK